MVIMGDAAHTAHFSIGSGTKLAMEDAIALFEESARTTTSPTRFSAYDVNRRDEVGRLQHAAEVSLAWFEHVERYWDMPPSQFAFGLLSRSKAITYDNLRTRDADFIADVDRDFAAGVAERENLPEVADTPPPPMFTPFTIGGMRLQNRVVVAPMCQYCAEDGVPGEWHYVHLTSRALGGAGLVYTEMACIAPDARITPGCAGIWNDGQRRRGSGSPISRTITRRRSSACRSAMPAGRGRPGSPGRGSTSRWRRARGRSSPRRRFPICPIRRSPARWTAPTWIG